MYFCTMKHFEVKGAKNAVSPQILSVQLVMSKTFFMLMVVISVYVTQIDRYLALVSSINFVDRFWDFFDPLPSSPSKYTDLLHI